MIDIEDRLRSELDSLVPRDSRHDWSGIATASGLRRERALRRLAAVAGMFMAAAVLALSTPLGAALVRSLDDFSAWLSGEPGAPASETDQREFEEANARSWLRFPQGTQLRKLLTTKAGDSTVELLGFRSGASELCLRIKVSGELTSAAMECAPLEDLRRAGGPARAIVIDHHVGRGDKVAWYGIDRLRSSALQITAGIAADGVRSVVLDDDAGRHEVAASSNAFLYVAEAPDVAQRVKRIWARTESGLVAIPFVPAPHGYLGQPPLGEGPAPPAVERNVQGGRISWLETREARGESLEVVPPNVLSRRALGGDDVLFGRVLTPDPDRPLRVVLTLNAHRPGGAAAGLCTWLLTRAGGSGGCTTYPEVFEGTQIPYTVSMHSGGAFVTVNGTASDHVARVEALLADGQRVDATPKNNVFVIDLPRASLPARLIVYDAEDRVLEVSRTLLDEGDRSAPARGRAKSLLRVAGANGVTAELFVGPSTEGGECVFVKHFLDARHAGVMVSCDPPGWTGPALQLGTQFVPPRLLSGRVRSDIKTVRIRFADGSTTTLTPVRGYVLWAAPAERLERTRAAITAEGLGADRKVVARQRLGPPGSATRSRRSSSRD